MLRFSDISITKKLILIMAIMAILITTELVALSYTIKLFSAVRSYVGGEGLWSKAQKDAAYYLIKYSYTHNEKDYQDYLDFLKVPLSDHQARLALSKAPIDYEAARQGFLGGRVHPDDIDGVIWLFTTFNRVYYINKAINVWIEADGMMEQFLQLGSQLHLTISASHATPADIEKQLAHIDELNYQLTAVEDEFSYTLGQASRWLESVIFKLLIGIAITVEFTGIILTILTALEISKNINAMNKVAKKIAKSDFSERVVVSSKDEIGQLAISFNAMIDELDENIKRQQQLEKKLIDKNIQLENANFAKDQFLSHMSHELRTPLNGIISMTQLLATSNLLKEQRSQLDIINESEQRLLFVINQILDFSKIKSGTIEIDNVVFNLRELIKKTLSVYEVKAKIKEIALAYRVDNNVSEFYLGDQVKIIQVLSNLIDNAIKFTSSGSVDVSISLQSKNDGTSILLFEVSDTGMGITPIIRHRLFESFSQGDFSVTRKYGGTGLGLSISKGLVEAMGGSIDVDAGELGSRFYFTVPLQETKPSANSEKISSSITTDAMTAYKREASILLAEDNKLNQKILKMILEKFGYKATIASDGIEVLDALNKSDYDLILMDCQMPNMDGYLTTKEIRKKEEGGDQHIPIIGVTANTTESDKNKCFDSGMNDYISKPFNISELHKLIRSYLEK